jgi:hypothetical protein
MGMLFGGEAAGEGWQRLGRGQGLPDEAVRALALDGDGRLWAGTLAGGLAVREGGGLRALAEPGMQAAFVRDLALSARGEVWAATDRGAVRIAGGKAEVLGPGSEGLVSGDLLRIAEAGARTWLLPMQAEAGVSVWDGERLEALARPEGGRPGEVLGVVRTPALPGLPELSDATLLVEQSALWRVEGAGLRPVELRGTPLWRQAAPAADEEEEMRRLPPVYLTAALQTSDGSAWLVGRAEVVRLAEGGAEELALPEGTSLGPFAVEGAGGEVWLAGFRGPLLRAASGAVAEVPLPLAGRETVQGLYAGRDGRLWVVTDARRDALLLVQAGSVRRLAAEGRQPLTVNDLLEAADGVWVASDDGLYRLPLP